MKSKQVRIAGGSVAGLATALALSRDGHAVTILERDREPLPSNPVEAFESWERRGTPQTRHSHAFLARLHNSIAEHEPALLAELLAQGAEPIRFADLVGPGIANPAFKPEDEEITALACRRITFEWVLRRYLLSTGRAEFCGGSEVTGLSCSGTVDGVPAIDGVQTRRENRQETLDADLVVDATGRRSNASQWLLEAGGRALESETEPCGIFYCSRFYRLRDGQERPQTNGIGADLGYLRFGVFPGDSRIFSVTLAASPDDDDLRSLRRPEAFEAATAQLPIVREWADPIRSEPISEVHMMSGLRNTRHFALRNGRACAHNFVSVGDALIHTNPIFGRGCTLAWVNAELLATALRQHPSDPEAMALALDALVRHEIVPWYEASRISDRDVIEANQIEQSGIDPLRFQREDGTIDPKAYMRSIIREGLLPGLGEDLELMRAFLRLFNLLEPAANLMQRPDLMQRVLAAWNRRHERDTSNDGPGRKDLIARLKSAA